MDSKRKANGNVAAAEELEDRAAKRRKIPATDLLDGENAETTAQYGLPFLEQVKKTADKSGRLVATNFLTLPSRRELPDYYRVIKMPIALDMIEEKLKLREFPNLTSLESYCKRMISNAKEYNQKGSEIYDDAERIRKALSNFMTKNNPAYKTPGYVAVPTPFPRDDEIEKKADVEVEKSEGDDAQVKKPIPDPPRKRASRASRSLPANNVVSSGRSSATPASAPDAQQSKNSFQGLTFQFAQEKLVTDMITHKEDDDDEFATFQPFVDLPPKSLRDYFQVIEHPVSLKTLMRRVKGTHGRHGPTDFKSWKSFEEEVEFIWKNAWQYNEDGSDIAALAKELKLFFYKQLAIAKKQVQEPPPQHKVKLKMSTATEPTPKITLRMGNKASPADSPVPPAGLNGRAGSPQHGVTLRRNPFANSQKSVGPNVERIDRARSFSGSAASPTPSTSAVVKNEDAPKDSPLLPPTPSINGLNRSGPSLQLNGNSMMPPSITPSGLSSLSGLSGLSNSSTALHALSQVSATSAYHAHNPSSESKWRQAGKDASDAMITNFTITTHPGLNIPRHFHMDLLPSPTMTQQSLTISLPPSHYLLQIRPTLAPALIERQHKLFFTSGTARLAPSPSTPGLPVDKQRPLFEVRLLPGVNRIEVELVAALPKGSSRPINTGAGAGTQDLEMEKITLFANLLR